MKKIFKEKINYVIALAVLTIIYLLLANYLFYYRIHQAGLIAPDKKGDYMLINNTNSSRLVYAALGDSLTSGVGASKYEESYPYLVASKLSAGKNSQIELKTFSYPGAGTSDLIRNLLDPAIASKPDIVTLLIGVNDIHGDVKLEDFEKNYDYILKRLTTETQAKIYVVGLPLLGTDESLLPPYNYYFAEQTQRYNEVIKSLSQRYKLLYIDLNGPTQAASEKNDGYYSKDLFHPSAKGYNLWAQIIYDNINN